ncbi:hypothetical protein RB195_019877 [Necator americanus]|uniref:G-protein coupled receptors family 1 profile domain-containing protein n=1 Tax=Necator americanus TaxID=51031 RepID=A0ABR1CG63_NECAM
MGCGRCFVFPQLNLFDADHKASIIPFGSCGFSLTSILWSSRTCRKLPLGSGSFKMTAGDPEANSGARIALIMTLILIVLCIADGINCFSIFLMGLNRVLLYTEVIDTLSIPIRAALECAIEPWLILRGYGDLWPPTVQFAMGIDRCIAVFNPISYSKSPLKRALNRVRLGQFPDILPRGQCFDNRSRRGVFFFLTIFAVTCELSVGYFISWSRRFVKVKYWCGRKAAFGEFYASFVYGSNILCYLLAFSLTVIAYFKSQYWMDSDSGKKQLARIRYQLIISILSIILISIPNGVSLFAQYISNVADAIAKPSTYTTCINSAINIFVYLVLYKEFRDEFMRIVLRINKVRTVLVTITTVF